MGTCSHFSLTALGNLRTLFIHFLGDMYMGYMIYNHVIPKCLERADFTMFLGIYFAAWSLRPVKAFPLYWDKGLENSTLNLAELAPGKGNQPYKPSKNLYALPHHRKMELDKSLARRMEWNLVMQRSRFTESPSESQEVFCEKMACYSPDIYSEPLFNPWEMGTVEAVATKPGLKMWIFQWGMAHWALSTGMRWVGQWGGTWKWKPLPTQPIFSPLLQLSVAFKSIYSYHQTWKYGDRFQFTSYILFMACYETLWS